MALPLADHFAIAEGLVIPLRSSSGRGLLILGCNPGLSIDDLAMAPAIAQEIAATLDRLLLSHISREVAVAQLRTTLARDLHDSVAQTLAGVRFRIEALRERRDERPVVILTAHIDDRQLLSAIIYHVETSCAFSPRVRAAPAHICAKACPPRDRASGNR
ncbi:MAG: histidine kinase [Erythrobacter sp.]